MLLLILFKCIFITSATIVQYTDKHGSTVQQKEIKTRVLTGQILDPSTTIIKSVIYDKNSEELTEVANFPLLKNLILDNSKHRFVPELKNIPVLQNIFLEKNHIIYIPFGRLTFVPAVYVFLRFNNIQKIEHDSFGESVKHIYLSCNMLSYFEPEWFTNPSKLEVLDLDANKITNIQENAFIKFTKLQYVYLLHNGLVSIESGAFSARNFFSEMWLGYNNLEKISSDIFRNEIITIEILDISYNNLTYLEKDFMEKVTGLHSINIDQNPWQCICYDNIIRPWLNRVSNRVDNNKIKCVQNRLARCIEEPDEKLIRFYYGVRNKSSNNREIYCRAGFKNRIEYRN